MPTLAPSRSPIWIRSPSPLRHAGTQVLQGLCLGVATAIFTRVALHESAVKACALLIVVGGTAWFASTSRPDRALALLMIYLGCLDGYLKLSSGSNLITFVRDILLYALAVGALVRGIILGKPMPLPPLGWIVALFSVVTLAQLLNPADGTLLHSLGGIKQDMEFVPLFFLTFAYARTTRALRVFVVLLLVIGAANGIVGLLQFDLSPAQLASWGPGYAERVEATGNFAQAGRAFYNSSGQELTRPFGLGSDSGDGGLMGSFALGGVAALIALVRRRRDLLFVVAMAIACVIGILTSEGRAAVLSGFVVVFAYALLTVSSRGRMRRLLALAGACLIALVVVGEVSSIVGSSAFRYQGLTLSHIFQTTSSARGESWIAIGQNITQHPFGAGLGVAGPAAGQKGGPPLANQVNAENELSFAIVETGIAGMLLIVAFTVVVFGVGIARCRREIDPEARILLAAIIAPIGAMIALYSANSLTSQVPGAPYLWGVGGIVAYWLIARPREAREAEARLMPVDGVAV